MKPKSETGRPNPKPMYEPPMVEDVPLSPDERLLAACKTSGSFNPVCLQNCEACSAAGS